MRPARGGSWASSCAFLWPRALSHCLHRRAIIAGVQHYFTDKTAVTPLLVGCGIERRNSSRTAGAGDRLQRRLLARPYTHFRERPGYSPCCGGWNLTTYLVSRFYDRLHAPECRLPIAWR